MVDMLKDKVAIVTGAGRGIGRGVAKLMAEEGAKVVVVDPGVNVDGTGADQSIAETVVSEIQQAGGTATACLESVVSMSGGERIVQTAVDNYGRLDIVVTCAGILRDRMIFNMTEQEWDDVIAVHLKRDFHGCQTCLYPVPPTTVRPGYYFQLPVGTRGQLGPGQLRRGQVRHRRLHQGGGQGHGPIRSHG